MKREINSNSLIVPVYINEKIVLDMLAIMEDGFSVVSQVNYTEQTSINTKQNGSANVSTAMPILSKLLRIDVSGGANREKGKNGETSIAKEKVHTNVSLFAKFRDYLIEKKMLVSQFDVDQMNVGDFIEVEGELQKSPLINYLEIVSEFIRLLDQFSEKPPVGNRMQANSSKQQNGKMLKQMETFVKELKHSGTIDFILSDDEKTAVLSVQEQYLSNDNVSEIIGGRFKILGKVSSVCRKETESINLLRKTFLSVMSEQTAEEMFKVLKSEELQEYNLPEFKTKIVGPAVIVIPIAIYA